LQGYFALIFHFEINPLSRQTLIYKVKTSIKINLSNFYKLLFHRSYNDFLRKTIEKILLRIVSYLVRISHGVFNYKV
jgi:hypothetical protein